LKDFVLKEKIPVSNTAIAKTLFRDFMPEDFIVRV
ncbi:MAG: hypothetical protein ACJA1B_001170, partial [Polaribacter sp.]